MRKVLGILLIIIGTLIGLYLGIYIMLFGGIVQFIDGLNPINAKDIALGIIKVLLCEIGYIPFILGLTCGMALYADD